jgi:hypothetical protein
MRAHTHVVFSTAVALWAVTSWQTALLAPFTTILIDMLGHSRSHGIPHRTWLTHDWVLSLPIFILPLSWVYTWTPLIHVPLTTALTINAVTLYTHLMLDGITGHTFILMKRVGHAYIDWDNPVANGLFIALGLILVLALGYYKLHLLI